MTDINEVSLYGFADPVGTGFGFLTPIFGEQTEYFLQKIDTDNRIVAFIPCRPPKQVHKVPDLSVKRYSVGDNALYAFLSPDATTPVFDTKENLRQSLEKQLARLSAHPFLQIEVIGFLNKPSLMANAIESAAQFLHKLDPTIATRWKEKSQQDHNDSLLESMPTEELEICLLDAFRNQSIEPLIMPSISDLTSWLRDCYKRASIGTKRKFETAIQSSLPILAYANTLNAFSTLDAFADNIGVEKLQLSEVISNESYYERILRFNPKDDATANERDYDLLVRKVLGRVGGLQRTMREVEAALSSAA